MPMSDGGVRAEVAVGGVPRVLRPAQARDQHILGQLRLWQDAHGAARPDPTAPLVGARGRTPSLAIPSLDGRGPPPPENGAPGVARRPPPRGGGPSERWVAAFVSPQQWASRSPRSPHG